MSDGINGPPPGWPAAPVPDPAPAGAFGPGHTMVGESSFTPSFPDLAATAPGGSTMVDPGGSSPAGGFGGGSGTQPGTMPAQIGAYGAPGLDAMPLYGAAPAPMQPAPFVQPMHSPVRPAPSKGPVVIGVAAIVVAMLGAIGVVVVRHRAAQSIEDEPAATVDLPKKDSKKSTTGSDDEGEAAAAAPTAEASAPEPEPTEPTEPEPTPPEATAQPAPAPKPTTPPKPTAAPKPTPTPTTTTTAAPKPTSTTPRPIPILRPRPKPTSTGPAPTSTGTSTSTGRRPIPILRR